MFVEGEHGLYVRTGTGAFTRITVNGAPAKSSRISLAVCRAQSKVMAVIYASPTGDLFVFRSADSGAGWAPMHFTETLLNGNYNQVIAIHPSNPDIMFVADYFPGTAVVDKFRDSPLWNTVSAVKNKRRWLTPDCGKVSIIVDGITAYQPATP